MATTPFSPPAKDIDRNGSLSYLITGGSITLASNVINPGDMLKWDTTNKCAVPATAGAEANFIGVSEGQNPAASNIDNGTTQGLTGQQYQPVKVTGVAMMKTSLADAGTAYVHGQAVAVGADCQTITNQSVTSNIVGYIWNPQGLTLPTGDGVSRVPVLFKSLYPTTF